MSRDPRSMSYDEITREIQTLKGDLERTVNRVLELSLAMYGKVRQTPSDEYSTRYLSFANTWTRFSQMVEVSLQRTGSAFRLIDTIKQEQREAEQEAARPARPSRKKVAPQPYSSDLSELYGTEMVTNASR